MDQDGMTTHESDPAYQARCRVMELRSRLPASPKSPPPERPIRFSSQWETSKAGPSRGPMTPPDTPPGASGSPRYTPEDGEFEEPLRDQGQKEASPVWPGIPPVVYSNGPVTKKSEIEAVIGMQGPMETTDVESTEEDYRGIRAMEIARHEEKIDRAMDQRRKLQDRQRRRRQERRLRQRFVLVWPCQTCGHRHSPQRECPLMERISHCATGSTIVGNWCTICKGLWQSKRAWICSQLACYGCRIEMVQFRREQLEKEARRRVRINGGLGTPSLPYIVE